MLLFLWAVASTTPVELSEAQRFTNATGNMVEVADEAWCSCYDDDDYERCYCNQAHAPSFRCSCPHPQCFHPPDRGPKENSYSCQNNAGLCKPLCGHAPPSNWPVFASKAALQASPWAKYLNSLYGELPSTYPLKLPDFWCFYVDKMSAAGVTAIPSVGQCPTSAGAPDGQRYDENNAYSSKDLTWAWHPLSSPVFNGFGSDVVVEVSHRKDPFGDEHHGMWFVYAKGSGVFLDLGKTKIFQDHDEANSFFDCKGCGNEDMCQAAAAHGYDTIQFIAHEDSTNYPCAKSIGALV